MDAHPLVTEYLSLGLAFDRLEPGFVDAYTGDPALRHAVESAPAPPPRELATRAAALLRELPEAGLGEQRTEFLAAHLRALECSGRKFAGDQISFIDEVRSYFDVDIEVGDVDDYQDAHRQLDEVLAGEGALLDRMTAHRRADEIAPERLTECVNAFSGAAARHSG
ncbi:MAG: DUF885 domain-containing protein, partial [Stackebrandtia sp.]